MDDHDLTLADALEREHREIDSGIEAFAAGLPETRNHTEPLVGAMAALRRHIYLEEEFLFPPLRKAGMTMPIFVMIREHGELWASMDALDALLQNRTAAQDTEEDIVLNSCRALLAQLDKHNSKEEPIIYSQADKVLSESTGTELQVFLETGCMPQGWVCNAVRQ